jgi:pentose-5-phosphate-3-epimerase
MDFKEFYPYVYKRAQEYILSHPEKKEEVTRLLNEIKES